MFFCYQKHVEHVIQNVRHFHRPTEVGIFSELSTSTMNRLLNGLSMSLTQSLSLAKCTSCRLVV